MATSENAFPGFMARPDEMTFDRRADNSTLSPARALEIVNEFEALTQDKDAFRTLRRIIRRSIERLLGGKLNILSEQLQIGIRETTPESIRQLVMDAYNLTMQETAEQQGINTDIELPPNWQTRRSKTIFGLGEALRDLGHPAKPITDQLKCKLNQLYKIYLTDRMIRRSITGMCSGRTAGGAPYFEMKNDDLSGRFELGERKMIQRKKTDTDRIIVDDNIIFGGHFVGYTHLGRPVFKILESIDNDLQEKLVVVDDDRYAFLH